jgi:uncharacterized protein (DUF305 family)
MPRTPRYLLGAAAVATALILGGCAGGMPGAGGVSGAPGRATASAAFGAADVTFAQMMIPHHEQAVDMSDDILAKDGVDQRIRDLATQIKAAQQPEITQLKEWLNAWGGAEDAMSGMPGMGDGSDGMMSDGDMMALRNASAAEAGRPFLEGMIVHHQGAIVMAQTELDHGENGDARALARAIVTSQGEEIGVMKELLASL